MIVTYPFRIQQLIPVAVMNANGERSNVMAKNLAISAVRKGSSAPTALALSVAVSRAGKKIVYSSISIRL